MPELPKTQEELWYSLLHEKWVRADLPNDHPYLNLANQLRAIDADREWELWIKSTNRVALYG